MNLIETRTDPNWTKTDYRCVFAFVTFAIGLVAPLDKANAVLGEVPEGINDRVNGFHGFSQRMWSFWEVLEREREIVGKEEREREALYLKEEEGVWDAFERR